MLGWGRFGAALEGSLSDRPEPGVRDPAQQAKKSRTREARLNKQERKFMFDPACAIKVFLLNLTAGRGVLFSVELRSGLKSETDRSFHEDLEEETYPEPLYFSSTRAPMRDMHCST